VDADLADYFGSISHTDLLKSVARRIVRSPDLPIDFTPMHVKAVAEDL